MTHDQLKSSFDTIAQQYDAVRPSYPAVIVPLVLGRLAPNIAPALFEIGCGSGQATELFARQHIPITASDISPALLAAARQRLRAYPNVTFVRGAFEDLSVADAAYSLVLSAQAFHWIDSAVGVPKLYRMMQPGGVVALVWNFIHYDATAALRELRDQLIALVPAFAGWPDATEASFASFAQSWQASLGLAPFVDRSEQILRSILTLTAVQFRQLIATFSWFQTQSPALQNQLLHAVDGYLAAQPAPIELPIRTLLVLANKAAEL